MKDKLHTDIAQQRIVSLQEASQLSSLSVDTLQRRHSDKILQLSIRRRGMRLSDVLRLGQPSAT
jgi:predicted HTH domain antitoxin